MLDPLTAGPFVRAAASVATFQKRAAAATGTASVRADRVSDEFGDLDLGVVARYSPHPERGVIALNVGWLREYGRRR